MPARPLSTSFAENATHSPCKTCVIQSRLEMLENHKPEGYSSEQTTLRNFCPCPEAREYAELIKEKYVNAVSRDVLAMELIESEYDIWDDFARELGFESILDIKKMSQPELELYLLNRIGRSVK
jgi:hypothetical protein